MTADRGAKVASPKDTPKIAVSLARAGWPVFPVSIYEDANGKRSKVPAVKWKEWATTDEATIRDAWAGEHAGRWIGVYAGKAEIVVLDVDPGGDASIAEAGLDVPETFSYPTHRKGGVHHVYAAPEGIELTIAKALLPGVDVRSGAGLMVYYGPALKKAPKLTLAPDWILVERGTTRTGGTDRAPHADVSDFLARCAPGKPDKAVRAVLARVTSTGMAREDMQDVVKDFVKLAVGGARGIPAALEEARATYSDGWPDADRDWDNNLEGSIRRFGLPREGVIEMSKDERREIKKRNAPDKKKGGAVTAPDDNSLILEDGPLAEAVAPTLAETWAYAKGRGLMRYAGGVYARADTNILDDDVRLLLREIAHTQHHAASMRGDKAAMTKAMTLLSRTRAQNVAKFVGGILAKSEPVFDDHPHLLNVLNGVVDLRTGELGPHDPALYLTNIAGAKYKPDARHADWDATLTALSPKVRLWMQYRIGQAATGHPPDDTVIVIVKGGGANGKSTWLNAIKTAFGTYEVRAPEKLLLPGRGDHSTELASIAGARLVTVEELPEGRHINVKRAKDLAGTGTLTARFLFQDNFSFTPVNATLISTNYTPQLSEVDDGTWRRFELVDFSLKYVDEPSAPHERPKDRGLVGRMLAGKAGRAEAVLAWIVEGARLWYANGEQIPAPPKSVAEAKVKWRSETDEVMAFAAERLIFGPGETVTSKAMAEAMTSWLFGNGSRVWSHKTITARLEGHDLFARNRVERKTLRVEGEQARAWVGVGLRPNETVLDSFNSIVSAHK